MSRRLLVGAAAVAAQPLGLSLALAQDAAWRPDRAVRLVVPVGAGSTSDAIARVLAPLLEAAWHQPVVVENRPGAGTAVGTALVARAPADGHAILLASAPFALTPFLHRSRPYDPAGDFAPVTVLARSPIALVAGSGTGLLRFADLRRHRGLTCGTAGIGSLSHVVLELLKLESDLAIMHVPYRGPAPAITALAGGEVHLMLGTPFELASPIAAGAVPLALTASERVADLPGVPTFTELGVPRMQVSHWFGLVAPAGTPGRTIAALHTATATAMASPEVAGLLSLQGLSVAVTDPSAFAEFLRTELDRWSGVVRQAGITAGDVAEPLR